MLKLQSLWTGFSLVLITSKWNAFGTQTVVAFGTQTVVAFETRTFAFRMRTTAFGTRMVVRAKSTRPERDRRQLWARTRPGSLGRSQIDNIFSGTQHPAFLCQDFIERNIGGVILPVVATEVPDKHLLRFPIGSHEDLIFRSLLSKWLQLSHIQVGFTPNSACRLRI